MYKRKSQIASLLKNRKRISKSPIIDRDDKYKKDPVLDKPDENDVLSTKDRKIVNKKKKIEMQGNIQQILNRERRMAPNIQMQQMKNTQIQNDIQQQFLQAQLMQNQLQNQSQAQQQSQELQNKLLQQQEMYNKLKQELTINTTGHDVELEFLKLFNKFLNRDISLQEYIDMNGYIEYPPVKELINRYPEISEDLGLINNPDLKNEVKKFINSDLDLFKYFQSLPDETRNELMTNSNAEKILSNMYNGSNSDVESDAESVESDVEIESGSLIDHKFIKSITNEIDPDSKFDPLLDSANKYQNPNRWYSQALNTHNDLTNQYFNSNSRDQNNIEEILLNHDNKIANFQFSGSLLKTKEYNELKKLIDKKYHGFLDKNIDRLVNKHITKDNFINDKYIKTIIKSSGINMIRSAGFFGDLWNKAKNIYTSVKDFGHKALRFIDSNKQIIPAVNKVASRFTGRNVDINPYYTKFSDIYSRLPNFGNGILSMGFKNEQIKKDIIDAFENNGNINDVFDKHTISNGINRVLLSSGLVQDLIDNKYSRDKIEKFVSEKQDKQEEDKELPKEQLKKLIKKIRKYCNIDIDDSVFDKLINSDSQTLESFLNIPEIQNIINNSKDKIKSGSFFESFWNMLKNLPRNLLSFASKAQPVVSQITQALGPISEVIPVVGTVASAVNTGFQTAANLNKKLVGRGMRVKKESVEKLKKVNEF